VLRSANKEYPGYAKKVRMKRTTQQKEKSEKLNCIKQAAKRQTGKNKKGQKGLK
jgi:hypothetical protein